jgi:predicted permease
MMLDVRYALRGFAKNPGFTTVAVITLALGIGANTAIFSVVNAVLLRPLPFKDSNQLVRLYENVPVAGASNARPRRLPGMNVRELLELRARSRTLSHVVSIGFAMVTAACNEGSMRLFGAPVSVATFPMLGVQPAIGRWFLASEETPGADTAIILSDDAWHRCFNRDTCVLGQTVTFTGRAPGGLGGTVPLGVPFTVVGVMPPAFHYPDDGMQFWTPMALSAPADGRPRRTAMMARLVDGASIDAAVAEVGAIVGDVRGATFTAGPGRFQLVRAQEEITAPARPALLVLTVAVGFVLLIACANVANLLLARSAARRREIAIRVAVGASRAHLIRQALTESVLLALFGGVIGTALAFGGVRLFRLLGTNLPRFDLGTRAMFPRLDEIAVDRTVLIFVVAVSAATGLLFGLAPAIRWSRSRQIDDLRESMASTGQGFSLQRGRGAQAMLVVAQVAMATLLFVGGALLIRSFFKLARVDPGYDPANVLTFQIAIPGERSSNDLRTFAEAIAARLASMPGVEAAAYARQLPTVNLRDSAGGLWRSPDPSRPPPPIGPDERFISRDYLKVMGIPMIAGRGFGENDGGGQPRVLLINQALARSDFAGENPIGQRVYIGRSAEPWEIVGVVADVRQFGLDRDPEPQFFIDVRQWPDNGPPLFPGGAYYVLKTKSDPSTTLATVRDVLRQFDPRASLDNIVRMDDIVSNAMTGSRMYAVLLGIFSAVAAALAVIGIYGVVAYAVAQRTREIGMRMALGAQRADVMGLVLRQGAALTVIGIASGLAAAAGVTRYLEGMLFGLTPLDPPTFVAATLTFAVVATVASYIPARRATKVDPLVALRCE